MYVRCLPGLVNPSLVLDGYGDDTLANSPHKPLHDYDAISADLNKAESAHLWTRSTAGRMVEPVSILRGAEKRDPRVGHDSRAHPLHTVLCSTHKRNQMIIRPPHFG
jgi:hypothetical protein